MKNASPVYADGDYRWAGGEGDLEPIGVAGSFGAVQWVPQMAQIYNPAFDVTLATLISAWVLDSGVVTPAEMIAGIFSHNTR